MTTLLYMTMSVDGYIATMRDETPWSDEAWAAYRALVPKLGAIVVGRRTYELMKNENEFSAIGNPVVVMVTTGPLGVMPDRHFTVHTPAEALQLLEQRGFSKVMIGGGGKLNGSFLQTNLIDELVLDIEPIVLGSGIPLFGGEAPSQQFQLVKSRSVGHIVQVQYKRLQN